MLSVPSPLKETRVVVRAEALRPDSGEMTGYNAAARVRVKVNTVPPTARLIAVGRTLRLRLPRMRVARALRWCLGVVALAAFGVLGGQVNSVNAKTVEWREEVPLQDGGKIVVAWRVELVAGEAFGSMVGAQRFTFTHPKTRQPVVWENGGKIGSRLSPTLLDIDADRLFLVMRAQALTDYDEMGCPTPPYFVFRYDLGSWVRIELADLPARLWKANLLGYPGENLIRESKGYITAVQVERRFDALRKRGDTEFFGRIDRRIRNPRSLGCSRGAIERVYGAEKYEEWKGTGTWLDKSEAEALNLLRRKSEGAKP